MNTAVILLAAWGLLSAIACGAVVGFVAAAYAHDCAIERAAKLSRDRDASEFRRIVAQMEAQA